MKAIVIAASGYIGNVVAERLMKEGYAVTGTTRSQESASKLEKQGIKPLVCSLEEPDPIIEAVDEADTIVYCAYGYNSIEEAQKEVLTGRSHLSPILEAVFGTGKKFLLTSGTGVVPDSKNLVYAEDTPLPATDSPVTLARRTLETEVQLAVNYNVCSSVLRPPCVYGRGGSFIVPRYLLDHALAAKESVYVEGSENHMRSAVHVDDFADLVVLALKRARAGSLYCTAAETGVKTLAIAEAISRTAGLGGKVRAVSLEEAKQIFGHWGEWWSLNNQCTGDRARLELGWKPHRLSLLEEIEKGSYAGQPCI